MISYLREITAGVSNPHIILESTVNNNTRMQAILEGVHAYILAYLIKYTDYLI